MNSDQAMHDPKLESDNFSEEPGNDTVQSFSDTTSVTDSTPEDNAGAEAVQGIGRNRAHARDETDKVDEYGPAEDSFTPMEQREKPPKVSYKKVERVKQQAQLLQTAVDDLYAAHDHADRAKRSGNVERKEASDVSDSEDEGSLSGKKGKKKKKRIPAIPKVHKADWDGFKNKTVDEEEIYAVEVLVGNPKFYWQRNADYQERIRSGKMGTRVQVTKDSGPTLARAPTEMPERIRVNSIPLLRIFQDVVFSEWTLEPTIFLRPYKFFTHYEKELRERLVYLEEMYGSAVDAESKNVTAEDNATTEDTRQAVETEVQQKATESTVNDVSTEDDGKNGEGEALGEAKHDEEKDEEKEEEEDEERLGDSIEAYKDLQCLIEFLDAEIYPTIHAIRDGSADTIYFRDLWHLYKPGTEVICPAGNRSGSRTKTLGEPIHSADSEGSAFQGRSQRLSVWRVLDTTWGRPRLSAPVNEDSFRPPAKKVNALFVQCYAIDWNGVMYGPFRDSMQIEPFDGERSISSLALIPFNLAKDHDAIRQRLVERGRKFCTFQKPMHMYYTGRTLTHHPNGKVCEAADKRSEIVDGHVIVDFREANRDDEAWTLELAVPANLTPAEEELIDHYPVYYWKDKDQKVPDSHRLELHHDDVRTDQTCTEEYLAKDPFLNAYNNRVYDEEVDGSNFTEEQFILLPDRVCAFILRRRAFALISIDGLRLVEPQAEGWKDLKLIRGMKRIVQAQVKMHFQEKQARQTKEHLEARNDDYDLVRGKGQGLIILLHGAPGVGKTSTAECVAESLGRPLYPITCGDLGTTAYDVEEALRTIFNLAEAWDCVLLLDEADVFLAQRSLDDYKRNALVSVFLRVLEYYTGILFLTTNRVGSFDEAFKSRVHLHLYYPPLNEEQNESIWRMNMERLLRRKEGALSIREDEIMQYARQHYVANRNRKMLWNGRQIRSAFQTAAAIAEYDAQEAAARRMQSSANDTVPSEVSPASWPSTLNYPVELNVTHFKIVAEASQHFDEYMVDTHGGTDADRAYQERHRSDNFEFKSQRHSTQHTPSNYYQQQSYQPPPPWQQQQAYPPGPPSPRPSFLAQQESYSSRSGSGPPPDSHQPKYSSNNVHAYNLTPTHSGSQFRDPIASPAAPSMFPTATVDPSTQRQPTNPSMYSTSAAKPGPSGGWQGNTGREGSMTPEIKREYDPDDGY